MADTWVYLEYSSKRPYCFSKVPTVQNQRCDATYRRIAEERAHHVAERDHLRHMGDERCFKNGHRPIRIKRTTSLVIKSVSHTLKHICAAGGTTLATTTDMLSVLSQTFRAITCE